MNNIIIVQSFLILLVGSAIYFRKPAIKWRRRRRWQIKSLPLRGASVTVETITPLSSPREANELRDDIQFRQYFLVNVTIRPKGGRWSRIPWTPSDLRLVPAEHWRPIRPDETEFDRYCRIESLEVVCGATRFTLNNEFTVAGPFDLRLRLAVRRDVRVLQFRYYLEQFGAFPLPALASAVVPDDLEIEPQLISANEP